MAWRKSAFLVVIQQSDEKEKKPHCGSFCNCLSEGVSSCLLTLTLDPQVNLIYSLEKTECFQVGFPFILGPANCSMLTRSLFFKLQVLQQCCDYIVKYY